MKPTYQTNTMLNIMVCVVIFVLTFLGILFVTQIGRNEVFLIEKVNRLEKEQRLLQEDLNDLIILIRDLHPPQPVEMPFLPDNVF